MLDRRHLLALLAVVVGAAVIGYSVPGAAQERGRFVPWLPPVYAVSPDGTHIATASETGRIRLWKSGADKPTHEIDGPARMRRLWFSADGAAVVAEQSSGFDEAGGVHLYDAQSGKLRHTWNDKESEYPIMGRVGVVGLLPQHDVLLLSWRRSGSEAVSLATLKPMPALAKFAETSWVLPLRDGKRFLMPPPKGVGAVALVDGETFEIAWRRGNAYQFDTVSKNKSLGIGTTLWDIRPAEAAGRVLADVEIPGPARSTIGWDLETGKPSWVLEEGHVIAIPSGDSTRLVARMAKHHAEIDGRTGKVVRVLKQLPREHGVALAPDGNTAYSIDRESGTVKTVPLGK